MIGKNMTITFAQCYATSKEVIDDQSVSGTVSRVNLMDKIKAASDVIMRRSGNFFPIFETRKFRVRCGQENKLLYVPALLSITTLMNGDTELTSAGYRLSPYNRMWQNGPYIAVEQDGAWVVDDDIEITGYWGLLEQTSNLGFSVTQDSSQLTITVANGSLISPGSVILIESEQEFVTAGAGGQGSPSGTSATSKLNMIDGALSSDSVITVDNGAEFFEGETIQIGVEDIFILKIGGHDLSVGRGWNNTTPADHVNDSVIRVYRTFAVVRGVNGTTSASHSNKAAGQYVVPDSVNYLCRQMSVLMRMKAESGFSGVTGNSESGSGRYYSEFPPNQMAVVLNEFNTGE
jgi:hypothetical protein